MTPRPPRSTLFPYTTLFRSVLAPQTDVDVTPHAESAYLVARVAYQTRVPDRIEHTRSEEHTSELQSPDQLVCRLLLEKKKNDNKRRTLPPLITVQRNVHHLQ